MDENERDTSRRANIVGVWKGNILEDLERELLEYENIGGFLVDIRKEFGGEDEELVKVVELRRLE